MAAKNKAPLIGFVGQGWIGKNYANDFEKRGYKTVRYALEEPYRQNKEKVREADIVIIAVPTPTTPKGFDISIVEEALTHIGVGKIAVLKSTILPGTTKRLQKKFPKITLMYSPEFLSESTAAYDASHPFSNIMGLPVDDTAHRAAAKKALAVMPKAPFVSICSSTEAEIIKYSHNASGYVQIIMFNMLYDLASSLGADWEMIQKALESDPYIPSRYAKPVHKSGRGAGGGCFIKDFSAIRLLMQEKTPGNTKAIAAMKAFEAKNIELLVSSKKDLHLLAGVYGAGVLKKTGAKKPGKRKR